MRGGFCRINRSDPYRRSADTPQAPEPEQIEIPVEEKPAEIMTFRRPVVSKPKTSYREKVEGEKRQLSLF